MKRDYAALVNRLFTRAKLEGIIQQPIDNETFDGKNILVRNVPYIFWGSCSYLGLETDERLKEASIDAIRRYGTQFSSSRTVMESGMYVQLEEMLSQIFGKPTILAPTTSLGHVSTLPLVLQENDAVILDQKVHNSVQNGALLAQDPKIHSEKLPHNRADLLETRIQILIQKYDRVWYLADGVYSMLGDIAPYDDLKYLLNKYPQFHLYIDDAHGFGWAGQNGSGTTLRDMGWHPRMILTTSLAKAFGSCGGALVFDNEEERNYVKNCGSSFIFSGPLQPALLGASIASAKIFLSEQIYDYQKELDELIHYFIDYAATLNLPLITTDVTPIFYVGVGRLEVGKKITRFLMKQGHFASTMGFPSVPQNNTGIRVCITRHHTKEEIKVLLDLISESLLVYLQEAEQTLEDVYAAFGMNTVLQS